MAGLDPDLIRKYGVSKRAWREQRKRDGSSQRKRSGSRRRAVLPQVYKDVPALGQVPGTVVRSTQTHPDPPDRDDTANREVA